VKKPEVSIFRLKPHEDFAFCHPLDERDFDHLARLGDTSNMAGEGVVPEMSIFSVDEGRRLLASDAPDAGGAILVLSDHAIEVLGNLIPPNAVRRPIGNRSSGYTIVLAPVLHGAIDVDQSLVKRFDDGAIMTIDRPSFIGTRIQPLHMFRIGELRVSPTYVTDEFKKGWTTSRLRGLRFAAV